MAQSGRDKKLVFEINELRSRLSEAEEALGAIQRGEVDALVVAGAEGDRIFTLQGAEHPYRVMVESINEGAATLLPDGTVLYSNRQFAKMLGLPLEKLIGRSLLDLLPSRHRSGIGGLIASAASGAVRCESELPRNGAPLPVYLSFSPFKDAEMDAVCMVATDLSEQKRAERERLLAERALQMKEEHHQLILSHIKDYAIYMLDSAGNVASWDLGAERLKGYSAEEVMGRHFSFFYAQEDVARKKPEHDLHVAAAEDRMEMECWRVRRDGSRFWANVILTPLRDASGELQGFINVTRDVTDRKRAEEDLQRLSARLMNLQDQERRRIARELHDSEGQNLSVLLMTLSKIKNTCPGLDQGSKAALSESIEIANQCLREIRTLSYLLHPPLLDEFGLVSALQWYVEGFSQRSGIDVELNLPPTLNRAPSELETSVFRLVQEGLTNIHRHSGSRTASIALRENGAAIVLSVEDHGKGMDVAALSRRNGNSGAGIGIAGMKERVRELGGTLEIESRPGKTRLTATLPLPARASVQGA